MVRSKKKFICINCTNPIDELYTKYSASVTRIANCVSKTQIYLKLFEFCMDLERILGSLSDFRINVMRSPINTSNLNSSLLLLTWFYCHDPPTGMFYIILILK